MHVESASRPTLTADLAAGLSRYLRVPVVGRFAIVDPDVAPGPGRGQLRPAGRGGGPALPPGGRPRAARPAPVLLVDDLVVSGWTLTLAARALRRAGARQVLPLALASGS